MIVWRANPTMFCFKVFLISSWFLSASQLEKKVGTFDGDDDFEAYTLSHWLIFYN